MFELLLIAAVALAFLLGFAIAWMLNAKTRAQLAVAEARAEEQAAAAADKLALVTTAKSTLSDTFKALSAEALDSSNRNFLELAKASLGALHERAQSDLAAREKAVDALVQPIAESLGKVDGKLGELERTRTHAYATIHEQVRSLVETQLPMLRSETANLVKALRQPTVRGRWGEVQLKRVVEMAGMLDHCDFFEQPVGDSDDGRLRPDLVVRLAGGRHIVVDAKTPIAAYLEAAEAADDTEREAHLKRHAQLVRAHVTALGRKSYWETFKPTPELVIMFLPGEMLFSAALESDPSLIKSVGTLEGRVLVSARRFAELGTAPEGLIESPATVDAAPRALQSPEAVSAVTAARVDRIAHIN